MADDAIALPAPMRECLEEFRQILFEQTRILDAVISDMEKDELSKSDKERREFFATLLLMLQALGVAIHSALRLTATIDMAIRDAFGIARSGTELAVNIAYMAVGGPDVARRARSAKAIS